MVTPTLFGSFFRADSNWLRQRLFENCSNPTTIWFKVPFSVEFKTTGKTIAQTVNPVILSMHPYSRTERPSKTIRSLHRKQSIRPFFTKIPTLDPVTIRLKAENLTNFPI
jgi:hypothetical protein